MTVDYRRMPEAQASAEIIIKKSRFIGHLAPANSVEEAEAFIANVSAIHKAANHNCFAYTLGLGVPVERFSDAGEPSGTAGRPMLEVLRKSGLVNTALVVTRYFGGTLLGANGLVRAYTESSAVAIEAAVLVRICEMVYMRITCDYGTYGKLEYELHQLGYTLLEPTFETDVSFALWVEPGAVDNLRTHIADWSRGQAQVSAETPQWVGIRDNGEVLPSILLEEKTRP